jgi:hypothetical protein
MKLPMNNLMVLLVLCFAVIIPAVVSASPQTVLLVSGSDTQSAGYTSVQPSNPLDTSSYSNGVWSSAVPIGSSGWYSPSQAPFGSGATWISSAATTEGGIEDQWRLFKIDFDIPEGSKINSAQLWYTADNTVAVYLNDAEISSTGSVYADAPSPQPYLFLNSYSVNFNPRVGSNTLKFVVRNWNGDVTYNPTGLLYKGIIEYETSETPVLQVIDAKMVSPNELGVGVDVTYPSSMPANSARTITLEATINGKYVKKVIPVTSYTTPGTSWGQGVTYSQADQTVLPDTPIRINLANEGVPRFTENENFDIIGYASYDGGPSSENSIKNVEILLPVVLLRGWVFFGGETKNIPFDNDVAYHSFEDALKTRGYYDSNNWEKPYKTLSSYRTLWDTRDKETLYDDPLKTTPAQTHAKLNLLLNQYVKPHSYADKVNIVGHSFGGLVGRYFASVDPRVNTVIMVGSPHMGLPIFYDGAFSFKSSDAMSKKIMPGSMAFWAAPTYPCLFLEDSTNVPNLFQNTIEGIGQSAGVKYYSIYVDTEKTDKYLIIRPAAKGKSTWYDVVDHVTSQGDGSVPSTSASAFGTPIRIENNPLAGSLIPSLVHVNLMNFPEVQRDAIDILTDTQ